jgi:purine nucleosidase
MDFNVQIDVQSSHYVIERSNPTYVTLAVSVETSLRSAYLARLKQAGPVAQLIARQAEAFAEDKKHETLYGQSCHRVPYDTINFQHDSLACAIALHQFSVGRIDFDRGDAAGAQRLADSS